MLLWNIVSFKVTEVYNQQIKYNGDCDSHNSLEMTRMSPNHWDNLLVLLILRSSVYGKLQLTSTK